MQLEILNHLEYKLVQEMKRRMNDTMNDQMKPKPLKTGYLLAIIDMVDILASIKKKISDNPVSS